MDNNIDDVMRQYYIEGRLGQHRFFSYIYIYFPILFTSIFLMYLFWPYLQNPENC